ncbi:MAG TPA: hypothetical protein VL172_16735 [Kofleriaceae bacterium]|jgi:hypothetical protein|nr:hypothetical protein [Kofleriaceae bacterium]
MRKLIATAAIGWGALILSPTPSQAYDHQHTHRWLTRMAIERVLAAYPDRYPELAAYLEAVVAGAEHEDDLILDNDGDPTTFRLQRHFYRPTDEAGLTMSGQTFVNSYQWGVMPSEQNPWAWDDALAAWQRGDIDEAMFCLGHVVHLIEDLTVPAHVHLDIHGPPAGDDYEDYCSEQTPTEFESSLPLPPEGAAIPRFASPYDAWRATATASYARNLYPGDLHDTAQAHGLLATMYPSLSWSWFSEQWSIDDPPVGSLGSDFWDEGGGFYYFKNAEHPAAVDVVAWDPADPDHATYGDAGGAPMVELFARDLIPVAVLHAAGVITLFLDTAGPAPAPIDDPPVDDPPADDPPGGCNAGGLAAPWLLLLALAAVRRFSCAR